MRSDHSHECRICGGSIDDCPIPNDECNDHPGDCDDCIAVSVEEDRVAASIAEHERSLLDEPDTGGGWY